MVSHLNLSCAVSSSATDEVLAWGDLQVVEEICLSLVLF